jgi:hypothetical protein
MHGTPQGRRSLLRSSAGNLKQENVREKGPCTEKLLCGATSFMKTCKIWLKEILQENIFNNCFTREMTELIFYILCNGSSIGGDWEIKILSRPDQVQCEKQVDQRRSPNTLGNR